MGFCASSGSWTDSAWYNLANDWNALEVEYLTGLLTGQMSLWVGGDLEQTLTSLNTGGAVIEKVKLGAMGAETGTRGTVYFDDFDSRRISNIGVLANPGEHTPQPTPAPSMTNLSYSYGSPDHVHAVTNVTPGTGSSGVYAWHWREIGSDEMGKK